MQLTKTKRNRRYSNTSKQKDLILDKNLRVITFMSSTADVNIQNDNNYSLEM